MTTAQLIACAPLIVIALAVYIPLAWYGLITAEERQSVRDIVRGSLSTLEESTRQAA